MAKATALKNNKHCVRVCAANNRPQGDPGSPPVFCGESRLREHRDKGACGQAPLRKKLQQSTVVVAADHSGQSSDSACLSLRGGAQKTKLKKSVKNACA